MHEVSRPIRLVIQNQLLRLVDPLSELGYGQGCRRLLGSYLQGRVVVRGLKSRFEGLFNDEVLELGVKQSVDLRTRLHLHLYLVHSLREISPLKGPL